ncbi:TonB-dependent receptor [Marinobacter sp. CHS3-4]|uniref:TonB-dependent receptor plug domain-containing protein n=1 Tax=Marinobacter sp. CHS3-4 TaxID=3045174 RepID=UPI0024B594DE|nr:TonB-dependent receptor [Marinobacter sp. CHS3-4]MDI9245306.1 TonB-dependent receptor [Marinobacter sp. CHS3-4]
MKQTPLGWMPVVKKNIYHSADYKSTPMSVTNWRVNLFDTPWRSTCVVTMSVACFMAASSDVFASEASDSDVDQFGYGLSASADSFNTHTPIPEVLTTTRLRQPKSRVPGTTSIITGDMIRQLGIMNLVDVFRLVPGMTVNYVGSNQPVTSYHGTVHYEQRRMQVQVDGRTAYRANLSDMDWNTMPVPLELIERIEVSRGPNSAAYGINAFLGTINIITRAPEDSAGAELRAVAGTRGYKRVFGSVADEDGDYDWRLAYEKRKSNGFDQQSEGGELFPFNDGYDFNVFNYDSTLSINPAYSLDFRGGVVDGIDEEDLIKEGKVGSDDDPNILVKDYYLQTRLNINTSDSHFFHIQVAFQNYKRRQEWEACIPEAEFVKLLPGYVPGPNDGPFELIPCQEPPTGQPFRASLNENIEESRLELEIEDTLLVSDDFKIVSGIGYREDTYRSETLFNGRGQNYQTRAFGNVEYSPFQWLTLNAGGNWEKTTTTDESYFSPRLAANFILKKNHTLRLVFSKAVRTPDAFEQEPDWSYRPRNVAAPFEFLEGARFKVEDLVDPTTSTYGKTLEEERITSREISYFGQFYLRSGTLSLEARYFNDEMRDMISGVISVDDWTIDNNVALDQQGFELEAAFEVPGTKLRIGYAYLDQDGRYTGVESRSNDQKEYAVTLLGRLSVRHSGSVALIKELPLDLTASTAYYWADEFRFDNFERADFRIARNIYAKGYSYELALTMQHYLEEDPSLSPHNIINDQNQFYAEAGIRF